MANPDLLYESQSAGESRCWHYAYFAAQAAGRSLEEAVSYARACVLAYRREVLP